jgi:hypothetical protein
MHIFVSVGRFAIIREEKPYSESTFMRIFTQKLSLTDILLNLLIQNILN